MIKKDKNDRIESIKFEAKACSVLFEKVTDERCEDKIDTRLPLYICAQEKHDGAIEEASIFLEPEGVKGLRDFFNEILTECETN
jgi:hemerythrin superfamily protein